MAAADYADGAHLRLMHWWKLALLDCCSRASWPPYKLHTIGLTHCGVALESKPAAAKCSATYPAKGCNASIMGMLLCSASALPAKPGPCIEPDIVDMAIMT